MTIPKLRLFALAWLLLRVLAFAQDYPLPENTPAASRADLKIHHVDTLNVHDPAIMPDPVSKTYYVYANYSPTRSYETLKSPNNRAGVKAWWSKDLINWHGPKLVYEVGKNFWADKTDAPWAPEVHFFKGKYYLFVTFNDWDLIIDDNPERPKINKRASQILVGDSPLGPFKPFDNRPHTPEGEMTLDGTFWYEDGQPWLIYCHEWVQLGNGLIKAIRLSDDLSHTIGDPITLIDAGDVDWVKRTINYRGTPTPGIVTDGPWLYRSKTGKLMMMWSSWSKDRAYTTSLAYSDNDKITGNWTHRKEPILQDDIGHGNIFRTFEGDLRISIHRYFKQPNTRMQIYPVVDTGNDLKVGPLLHGHP